ncbi:TrmH family RNA methyltransferase [Patescibacteria group bacterium]|nr:TrmH family RNA methyltransferase [Patescibacteria group bacterium]
MIVVAHNIRSLHNIGSIFRNCAAFGVEKLYLTGYTASPPRKEIAKVALGSDRLVDWEQTDIFEIISNLQKKGYTVYGLETGPGALNIRECKTKKNAIILGNEVDGIDAEVLKCIDEIIEIKMAGKRSLNVSVASGIAMFALQQN